MCWSAGIPQPIHVVSFWEKPGTPGQSCRVWMWFCRTLSRPVRATVQLRLIQREWTLREPHGQCFLPPSLCPSIPHQLCLSTHNGYHPSVHQSSSIHYFTTSYTVPCPSVRQSIQSTHHQMHQPSTPFIPSIHPSVQQSSSVSPTHQSIITHHPSVTAGDSSTQLAGGRCSCPSGEGCVAGGDLSEHSRRPGSQDGGLAPGACPEHAVTDAGSGPQSESGHPFSHAVFAWNGMGRCSQRLRPRPETLDVAGATWRLPGQEALGWLGIQSSRYPGLSNRV